MTAPIVHVTLVTQSPALTQPRGGLDSLALSVSSALPSIHTLNPPFPNSIPSERNIVNDQ